MRISPRVRGVCDELLPGLDVVFDPETETYRMQRTPGTDLLVDVIVLVAEIDEVSVSEIDTLYSTLDVDPELLERFVTSSENREADLDYDISFTLHGRRVTITPIEVIVGRNDSNRSSTGAS